MAYQPDYPFPRLEDGQTLEVADGVHWIRMPLPFALDHINLWLLADGDGWTVIDTGYNSAATRDIWKRALGEIAGGGAPARVICSHFHPDHMGLAGWFAAEFGASLWMTYSEWLQAHLARSRQLTHDFERWDEFFVENGASAQKTDGFRTFLSRLDEPWYSIPQTVRRIRDGEDIPIGDHTWRVITGGGHTHEHASLWCAGRDILISGDQILPRITSNISLWYTEPEGDPLGDYLESFAKFGAISDRTLVLPSHGYPFRGIHGRIGELRDHHEARLETALAVCAEPRTADEVIPFLFDRDIGPDDYSFAIGETLAHLNRLVSAGRLERRRSADGLIRYLRP